MKFQFNFKFLRIFQKNKYIGFLPNFSDEKIRNISISAITIFFVFMFSLFAMLPTISSIAQLQQKKDTDALINDQLQQKINNLSILQQKYNAIQSDIPYVLAAVPQKTEMPTIEGQLQALVKQAGLELISLQAVQTSDNNTLPMNAKAFGTSVSATGDYQSLLSFISNALNIQRIITLDAISISKKSGDSQQLQFSFRAKTYFKP